MVDPKDQKIQDVLDVARIRYNLKEQDDWKIRSWIRANWRSIVTGQMSWCSDIELAERAMGIWREG